MGVFDKVTLPEAPEALPQLSVEELNDYFHSLANATNADKDILTALVNSNATLTSSNATLTDTVVYWQKQLANLGKNRTPPQENNRQCWTFPNCKKYVYHEADDCYELK